MARELAIFIDVSDNQLIKSLSDGQVIDPRTLPFFYGDTLAMKVFLMRRLEQTSPVQFNYEQVSTAGLSLFAYLDDGKVGGTIYTQQVVWAKDANNQYFYANFPLNTVALSNLIGAGSSANAILRIGYTNAGLPTTVFAQQVLIGVGIPGAAQAVPAGQTPLSAEVANQTYVPIQGKAGMVIQLISPNGKIIIMRAVDNPDGSASFQSDPV